LAKANAHSQGSEALSLAEWRLRLAMSQNRHRARVETGGNKQRPLITSTLYVYSLQIMSK